MTTPLDQQPSPHKPMMAAASSVEYKTLIRCNEELCLAVKADLIGLSVTLVSKELISPNKAAELRNTLHPEDSRSAHLILLIQDKVLQNPENYYTFVTLLRDRDYTDTMQKLETTYNKRKPHCMCILGSSVATLGRVPKVGQTEFMHSLLK